MTVAEQIMKLKSKESRIYDSYMYAVCFKWTIFDDGIHFTKLKFIDGSSTIVRWYEKNDWRSAVVAIV